MSVLVVGDATALALAGVEPEAHEPRLIVALDDAEPPAGAAAPVLRWWRDAPTATAAGDERVIAPSGDGLWSRAPWPVREDLFALEPASVPGHVLLVEPDAGVREATLAELHVRGVAATAAERLSTEALAAADVVLHGVGEPRPLPGDVFAVLAAGRLLITNADPAFGLRGGVDHLVAEVPALACDLAEAVIANPAAFAAQRRFGRIAAARHSAPVVYRRLLFDLAAG